MGFVNLMLIILILLIVLTMLALVYLFTGNIQSDLLNLYLEIII